MDIKIISDHTDDKDKKGNIYSPELFKAILDKEKEKHSDCFIPIHFDDKRSLFIPPHNKEEGHIFLITGGIQQAVVTNYLLKIYNDLELFGGGHSFLFGFPDYTDRRLLDVFYPLWNDCQSFYTSHCCYDKNSYGMLSIQLKIFMDSIEIQQKSLGIKVPTFAIVFNSYKSGFGHYASGMDLFLREIFQINRERIHQLGIYLFICLTSDFSYELQKTLKLEHDRFTTGSQWTEQEKKTISINFFDSIILTGRSEENESVENYILRNVEFVTQETQRFCKLMNGWNMLLIQPKLKKFDRIEITTYSNDFKNAFKIKPLVNAKEEQNIKVKKNLIEWSQDLKKREEEIERMEKELNKKLPNIPPSENISLG